MARDISRADGSKGVLEITRDQLRTARDLLRKCDFGTPDAEYITRLEKTSSHLDVRFTIYRVHVTPKT